uniref:Uncharacterized protein n=1 Tax=Ciona savignyi TaxID=51511 RepID=H2Z8U1_CIOSA
LINDQTLIKNCTGPNSLCYSFETLNEIDGKKVYVELGDCGVVKDKAKYTCQSLLARAPKASNCTRKFCYYDRCNLKPTKPVCGSPPSVPNGSFGPSLATYDIGATVNY